MLQEKGIDKARGILLFSWLQSKSRLLHLAELPSICHDPSRHSSLPSFIFNGVSLAQAGLRAAVQLRMNLDSRSPCLHFLTARPLQVCSTTPDFIQFWGRTSASPVPGKHFSSRASLVSNVGSNTEQTKPLAIVCRRVIAHPGPVLGTHFTIPAKVGVTSSFHR